MSSPAEPSNHADANSCYQFWNGRFPPWVNIALTCARNGGTVEDILGACASILLEKEDMIKSAFEKISSLIHQNGHDFL
jgi:hypothetical protein